MVFTVSVRHLSFKQDMSNITSMLYDQQATYAILKYAQDLPKDIYDWVLEELVDYRDAIIYNKLLKLVDSYDNSDNLKLRAFFEENSDGVISLDFNEVMKHNAITNTLKLT